MVDTSKLENEAVIPYVPANGVILATTEVEYTPGENVFEVLKRVTRDQGIQMEFRDDPLYSGAYIEGINYLYEFDGGTLSGWMYKVNGQFPNYGCSQYFVEMAMRSSGCTPVILDAMWEIIPHGDRCVFCTGGTGRGCGILPQPSSAEFLLFCHCYWRYHVCHAPGFSIVVFFLWHGAILSC